MIEVISPKVLQICISWFLVNTSNVRIYNVCNKQRSKYKRVSTLSHDVKISFIKPNSKIICAAF